MTGRVFSVSFALMLPCAMLAQEKLPPAPARRVTTVSAPSSRGNEPSIAVNPNNPNQVVAAFQSASIRYSTDGAQTFATAELPPVDSYGSGGGDVSVAFDDKGHAYLGTLHYEKLGSASYWAHGAGKNGIFVRRSPDAGKTWEKDAVAVKSWQGNEPDLQFEDMPRVFADSNPHSPYAGNVYVGWIEWQIDKSIILFSRSTDGGKTFSPAIRISTHAGLPRDDNGALVGFTGAIASDGTIYAAWNDGSTISSARSLDGGKSFAPSRAAIGVGPPYFGGAAGIPGVPRAMGFPQIGVDPRGKRGGTIYLSWSDFTNGDIDVFCASSGDHGRTWSKPRRVNTDHLHNGIDQFFQWMTVDPVTGDVYVQFYDRRDDPTNHQTGFTIARSSDGAKTFTNYAWSEAQFDARNAFLGDYTWLTAYDNKVFGVWTETEPPSPSEPPPAPGRPLRPETVVRVGFADFTGVQ